MSILRKSAFQKITLRKFDASPFESLVCTLCMLVGTPVLLFGGRPESIDHFLPEFLVRLWGLNLLLGAVLVVYGGLLRTDERMHKAGLNLVGSACVVYGACAVFFSGTLAAIGAIILIAIGLACVRRAMTLHKYVVVWSEQVTEQISRLPSKRRSADG